MQAGTPPLVIIFFVGAIALFVLVGIAIAAAERRRREGFAVLADRLGFSFDPAKRSGRPPWGGSFELFRRANPYGTRNHLSGEWRGLPSEVFDYTYYTVSHRPKHGTSRNYSTRTVVALELPQVFPELVIKPDSPVREFFEFLGGQDIDFESDVFNKRYYVKAADRKFAYDVIQPRMMDFLLRVRGVTIHIIGGRMILYHERRLKPVHIEPMLQLASDFYEKLPDFVKKDYTRA